MENTNAIQTHSADTFGLSPNCADCDPPHNCEDCVKKEFLERHNISEDDVKKLVKESSDYDLPEEESEEFK